MLKNAGYVLTADSTTRTKDGTALSFTLLYPDLELYQLMAQSIQDNWSAIGVDVKLQAVTYEVMLNDHLSGRSYEAALVDLDLSRSYDPDPYPFWHQAEAIGGQNYSQWDNRSASEYLEQARVITNPDTRMRLYRNFQVIFARELPALPLFFPVYTYAVDERVLGVQSPPLFEPADRFSGISSWYLVTRRALEQTQQPVITP
jgi:peptide/nickel transport system substrate-binding protein